MQNVVTLTFQLHGLALCFLAAAALLYMAPERRAEVTSHLGWLAAFALLYGLHQVLVAEHRPGPTVGPDGLLPALPLAALVALLEFGRRLCNAHAAGRWLRATVVHVAAALGLLLFLLVAPGHPAGIEAAALVVLGPPAALLTALGLRAHVRDAVASRCWLRISALAVLAHGLLGLMTAIADAVSGSGSGLLLDGVLQPLRALSAMTLALGFFLFIKGADDLAAASLQRVTDRLDGFVYRCLNDERWTVTFMSEGGETLTGYPASDFRRGVRHFADQIHPDDRQRVWDEVQAALAQRSAFRLKYRMHDSAGGIRWCYEEGRGVFDSRGMLRYLEGLVRDDQARHLAETGQRRIQALVEAAPQAVGWADATGTLRYCNAAMKRLLGLPEGAEVSGYHLREFYEPEHFAVLESETLPAVMAAGEWVGELPVRALNGRSVPTLHSVFALSYAADEHDDPLMIANVITDLSELKRTQQALAEVASRHRQLFELSTDGIAYADPATSRLVHANPSFARMLGRDEADIERLSVADLHPPEAVPWVLEQFEALASGRASVIRDVPMRRRDGSVFHADITASLLQLEEGTLLAGIFRDVSERRREALRIRDLNQELEQRVRERTAELERASAAKSEFLSHMSHELRTPLHAILGFTQLLQLPDDAPLSARQVDNVLEIHRAGEHLLGLVNEILDLARIESGQLEVHPEPIPLVPAIEQAAAQVEAQARRRDIRVRLHTEEHCTVLADRQRLHQVLLNLLSNAVKYNRDGGQVAVECTLGTDRQVRISVRDTGPGLTPDQQARLFRPFERLVSPYEGIEGAGIGLVLARQLVEAMQGRIGVNSVPGEGSEFWFELPLCDAPGAPESGQADCRQEH